MNIVKKSYGIALCRYNEATNNPEVMMIKKRYTYCYSDFVLGKYDVINSGYMSYLFNNMTYTEKLIILTMSFNTMWRYLWLLDQNMISIFSGDSSGLPEGLGSYFYQRKKNAFAKNFKSRETLVDLMNKSSNCGLLWEIPKGKKEFMETDIDAAIREFKEETGITIKNYKLVRHITPITQTKQHNKIVYKFYYFVAHAKKNIEPKIMFDYNKQLSEVSEIAWMDICKMNSVCEGDTKGKNKFLMRQIFDVYRKNYSGPFR